MTHDGDKMVSTKPVKILKREWTELSDKDIEDKIVELYKQGHSPAKIGEILRDQYGVPSVRAQIGKKLVEVLKERGVYSKYPQDFTDVAKKVVNLEEHLKKNKKDYKAKRALQIATSKLRAMGKYLVKKGVLDKNWRLDKEELRLIIR